MRKTDSMPGRYEQSHRIVRQDDRWYLRTREGRRGPFPSRRSAAAELTMFLDTLQFLEDNEAAVPAGVDRADITVVDMDPAPWR